MFQRRRAPKWIGLPNTGSNSKNIVNKLIFFSVRGKAAIGFPLRKVTNPRLTYI